jgi:hypothetical protein
VNDRLVAIEDRLFRADENLNAVKEQLKTYYASDAYHLRGEFNPETDAIHVVGGVIPPPIRVFSLVGDILHELRSALDHLAWQLVRENGGNPGDSTAWPIISAAPLPYKKGPNRGQLPLPNVEGGVSDTAREIMGEAQPYQWDVGYEAHPFYILNWLNIRDKHRHIAIRGVDVSNLVTAVGIRPLEPVAWTARTVKSDEYGAEVEFVPDDPEVDVTITGTLQVRLHEDSGRFNRPLFETLSQLREAVWTTFLEVERDCFQP